MKKTVLIFGLISGAISAAMMLITVPDGRLSFGRGFAVGILIALISSACYVGAWEIVYFKFMPDFAEKYSAHMVEKAKASGESQQKVDDIVRRAKAFKEMYDNLAINIAMTFMEVFPIGLVVTLISAGLLRKKPRALCG
jgi:hypothetical protein